MNGSWLDSATANRPGGSAQQACDGSTTAGVIRRASAALIG